MVIGNTRNAVSRVLFWKRERGEFCEKLGWHTSNRLRGTHWVRSPELSEPKKTHWVRCLKPCSPKPYSARFWQLGNPCPVWKPSPLYAGPYRVTGHFYSLNSANNCRCTLNALSGAVFGPFPSVRMAGGPNAIGPFWATRGLVCVLFPALSCKALEFRCSEAKGDETQDAHGVPFTGLTLVAFQTKTQNRSVFATQVPKSHHCPQW